MVINSNKTLFINNGFSIYSNKIDLIIKIILYNFNPLYGIIKTLLNGISINIIILIMIILIAIILIEIIISFYKYCFYPNIFSYFCFFFEIFSFFSNITELIIYLTDYNIDSLNFFLIKISFEFINSLIFTILLIQKKNKNNIKKFSLNLFNKTFKNLNPDDIYFYIKIYLKYSKNKENNYIKIFRFIQYHSLSCEKKECPCKNLVTKNMLYSGLTNFNIIKREENQNIIEEKSSNNINNNSNKILTEQNMFKKYNSNFSDANNKSFKNMKGSAKNLMMHMKEEENLKINMRKRTYSVKKNIQHSEKKNKNFIRDDSKENKNSNIINESNIKVNNSTTYSNSINKKEINPNIEKKFRRLHFYSFAIFDKNKV